MTEKGVYAGLVEAQPVDGGKCRMDSGTFKVAQRTVGHGEAGVVCGTLILPEGLSPGGAVAFRRGRIEWVGLESELPSAYQARPVARAAYVGPGLIDLHLHGSGGHEVMSADPKDWAELARFLAAHGTTAFLATTLSATREALVSVARATASYVETAAEDGAELLGLHLEGPYVNPAKAGAQAPDVLRPLDLAEVERLQELSGGRVRLLTLAPELARAEDLQSLRRQGIRLSAGHSGATYDEARQAFTNGVDQVTHLFNAMPPLGHREPGLAGAALATSGVYAQLILDLVHVHPAVARLAIRAKGPGEIVLITDALSVSGLPPGRYSWDERPVDVRREAVYLVNGPLAGSNLTLLQAVHMAAGLGLPLAEAWRMASLTPAQALGLDQRKGQLLPGYDADLLLLEADLSLTGVLCRGCWVGTS